MENNNNTNEGVFDVAAFLFVSAAAAAVNECLPCLAYEEQIGISRLELGCRERRRKMRENWKDEWKGKN